MLTNCYFRKVQRYALNKYIRILCLLVTPFTVLNAQNGKYVLFENKHPSERREYKDNLIKSWVWTDDNGVPFDSVAFIRGTDSMVLYDYNSIEKKYSFNQSEPAIIRIRDILLKPEHCFRSTDKIMFFETIIKDICWIRTEAIEAGRRTIKDGLELIEWKSIPVSFRWNSLELQGFGFQKPKNAMIKLINRRITEFFIEFDNGSYHQTFAYKDGIIYSSVQTGVYSDGRKEVKELRVMNL